MMGKLHLELATLATRISMHKCAGCVFKQKFVDLKDAKFIFRIFAHA